MDKLNKENIIESILFASGEFVLISKLCILLKMDKVSVMNHINTLIDRYRKTSLEILVFDGYVQMCCKKDYIHYINSFFNEKKKSPISSAALEVLSIIAYNKSVTKNFVEKIRGVDCSYIINSLLEKDLIQESGRLNLPGKPITYETTPNFLRCFNLDSLESLPNINEFRDVDFQNQESVLENQLTL